MAQPAGTYGIRDLLTKLGAENEKIGFDPKTQTVLYDNKPLIKAAANIGGTTYARPEDIMRAASGIGLGGNVVQTRDYLESKGVHDVGWNPMTSTVTVGGRNLLQPLFVSGGRSYNLASDVDRALGTNQVTAPTQQRDDLLEQILTRVNQPFQYDPSKDPAYQAAVQGIQRDVMETMNERGILNSTITRDDMTKLMAQAVPAFAQQAYGREQDVLRNLFGLADVYSGIEQQNYARQLQERQDAIQQEQQKLANAWARVNTLGYVDNEASKVLGIPVGTPTFEARNAYENRKAQMDLAQMNINADMEQFWANYGLEQQGLDLRRQELELSRLGNFQEERAGLVEAVRSGQMTPRQALQQIDEDTRLGFYTPAQAEQLKSDLAVIARSAPQQQVSQEALANLPSVETLEKQWYTDPTGKAAGTAKYDWISWNRDINNGRPAGVPFKEWKSLYGPALGK